MVGGAKSCLAQDSLSGKSVRLTTLGVAPRNVIVLDLPDVRYPQPDTSSVFLNQRQFGSTTRLLWGNGGVIRIGVGYEVQVDRLEGRKSGRSRVIIAPANSAAGIGLIHTDVFSRKVRLDQIQYETLSAVMRDRITVDLPAGIDLDLGRKFFSRSPTEQSWHMSGLFEWKSGNGYTIQAGEGYDIGLGLLAFAQNGRVQVTLSPRIIQFAL